jgi:hypothetical protein
MTIYYTEYPKGEFQARTDDEALKKSHARIIYKESETVDGRPFIFVREIKE